jgi:hypothetical protein
MNWGGPEFVLCIIGMTLIAGVLKSWGRAAHGLDKRGRKLKGGALDPSELAALRAENAQLRDRLELHEDRLITIERIVTDSGYDLARQIERLRDVPASRIEAARDRTAN